MTGNCLSLVTVAWAIAAVTVAGAQRADLQPSTSPPDMLERGVRPWDSEWPNTVALCAIMKDEHPEDIRQWLRYHQLRFWTSSRDFHSPYQDARLLLILKNHYCRWLGVDKVLLTDNNSARDPQPFIQDWIRNGFVEYSTNNVTGMTGQASTYQKCIDDHRLHYSWIAFFDLDEMIVVLDRQVTLKSMLHGFRFFPGLSVHWLLFGASGRRTRPAGGGMLQHYTQCGGEPRTTVKTIANTYHILGAARHAHNVHYRSDGVSVNEGRYPLELICPVGGEADPKGRVPGPCTEDSTSTHHSITHPGQASVNHIAAFHYITRSWEDYEIKMTRQFSVTRGPEFFDHVQRRDNRNDAVCKVGLDLYKRCCRDHDEEDAETVARLVHS